MIKFDFSTYINQKINIDNTYKNKIIDKLKNDSMAGFYNHIISDMEIERIRNISNKIKSNSDILIIIGIGGSFMGSYAIKNIFLSTFKKINTEVIYLGTDLSSKYLSEVLEYIEDKRVSINVISKSGSTLEINLIYKLLKKKLEEKYTKEQLKERIIITTDKEKGILREEANNEGYTSFEIPTDIGGRYSLLTAAHLFPLAVMGLDIENLKKGYLEGIQLIDEAFHYASLRIDLFNSKKYIENFSIYDNNLYYYTEWIKQLFGESEGKQNKGIFPVSTVNTRDLHSLGQFIQQGNNIIFETVIKIQNIKDVEIQNNSLNNIKNLVCESVCAAHQKGNTPSILIVLNELNLKTIGELSAFFMLSAAFSAYLFDVNPFDQPGVEDYKNEIKKRFVI